MNFLSVSRRCKRVLIGAALLWGAMIYSALANSPFDIRSAYLEPLDRGFALHATVDLGLSKSAEEAVRNGVPVKVSVDVLIVRKRHLFIDKKLEDRSVDFIIKYDALSDRYLVTGSDNQSLGAFQELNDALNVFERLDSIKVLEKESLNSKDDVEASIRVNVSVESGSSTVMRYLMFWIDWRRSTDWYTWHVKL